MSYNQEIRARDRERGGGPSQAPLAGAGGEARAGRPAGRAGRAVWMPRTSESIIAEPQCPVRTGNAWRREAQLRGPVKGPYDGRIARAEQDDSDSDSDSDS